MLYPTPVTIEDIVAARLEALRAEAAREQRARTARRPSARSSRVVGSLRVLRTSLGVALVQLGEHLRDAPRPGAVVTSS